MSCGWSWLHDESEPGSIAGSRSRDSDAALIASASGVDAVGSMCPVSRPKLPMYSSKLTARLMS
ncbi:hypothetical protein ACFPRL_17435 [Pseudoclavibacter helvolus]